MPIEVRHDVGLDLLGAIEFLKAEQESRRQREAEQAALNQQLVQSFSAPQYGQQQAPPSRAVSSARSGRSPGNAVAQHLALLSGGGRGSSRQSDPEYLAAQLLGKIVDNRGDLEREMVQGQFDLAQQGMGDQADMALAELQGNMRLSQEFATDPQEEWLRQGLQSGALRYSLDQQSEMRKIQDSINRARTDPTLTEGQRQAFLAQQYGLLRTIRDNPEEVPFDERPKTPQQIFEEWLVNYTDPNTGEKGIAFLGSRDGNPHPMPLKGENNQAKLQLEQQKFEYNNATNQLELERQERTANINAISEAISTRIKLQTAITTARSQIAKAKSAATLEGESPPDFSAAEKEIEEMEEMLKSITIPSEYVPPTQQMWSAINTANSMLPPGASAQPAATQATANQPQRPVWETMPPASNGIPTGEMGYLADTKQVIKRVGPDALNDVEMYAAVTSREEVAALQPGEKFILPDGRTGKRQ